MGQYPHQSSVGKETDCQIAVGRFERHTLIKVAKTRICHRPDRFWHRGPVRNLAGGIGGHEALPTVLQSAYCALHTHTHDVCPLEMPGDLGILISPCPCVCSSVRSPCNRTNLWALCTPPILPCRRRARAPCLSPAGSSSRPIDGRQSKRKKGRKSWWRVTQQRQQSTQNRSLLL